MPEEDVDDARIRAPAGIRRRHANGVVADVIPVDVTELRHRRERPIAVGDAEGGDGSRRQRAVADAAREDAEADDRRDQSEQVPRAPQHYPLFAAVFFARGRHGLGLTFTRLPLTVWYFGLGFLMGQSGSF